MPKYMTDADRAEEAETLMAALTIIRLAGLDLDAKLPILPPEFARCLTAPRANLLIVPSTTPNGSDRQKVAGAMRVTRCDALIVRISRPRLGARRVTFDVGQDGRECVWHEEYRACLLDGAPHLVPDYDPSGPMFKLTRRGLIASVHVDDLQSDVL